MQNVVMSVYGDNPRYKQGALIQAPIWISNGFNVTVYTDNPSDYPSTINVILKEPSQNGVFWRFNHIFYAGKNDLTLIRDADGRPTEREFSAIEEFKESDKKFHIFRDHEAHLQWPIIACAFAIKGSLKDIVEEWVIKSALKAMVDAMDRPFYYTNDQVWLRDWIWPYVAPHSYIHSIEKPGWFKESRKKGNRYQFCGNGWDENNMPLYPPEMSEMINWVDVKKTLGEEARYRYEKS